MSNNGINNNSSRPVTTQTPAPTEKQPLLGRNSRTVTRFSKVIQFVGGMVKSFFLHLSGSSAKVPSGPEYIEKERNITLVAKEQTHSISKPSGDPEIKIQEAVSALIPIVKKVFPGQRRKLEEQINQYVKELEQKHQNNPAVLFKALSGLHAKIEGTLNRVRKYGAFANGEPISGDDKRKVQSLLKLLSDPAKQAMESSQPFEKLFSGSHPIEVKASSIIRAQTEGDHRIDKAELKSLEKFQQESPEKARTMPGFENPPQLLARTKKDFLTLDFTVKNLIASSGGKLEENILGNEKLIKTGENKIWDFLEDLPFDQRAHVLSHLNGIEIEHMHKCYEKAFMDEVPEWGNQWGKLEPQGTKNDINVELDDNNKVTITYTSEFTPAFSSKFGEIKNDNAQSIKLESHVVIEPDKAPEYSEITSTINGSTTTPTANQQTFVSSSTEDITIKDKIVVTTRKLASINNNTVELCNELKEQIAEFKESVEKISDKTQKYDARSSMYGILQGTLKLKEEQGLLNNDYKELEKAVEELRALCDSGRNQNDTDYVPR